MMRPLFLSLPILAVVGACTSSSEPAPSVLVPGPGVDGGSGNTPPGTPPATHPGGPECAKDYEPIADAIKRYDGRWLVDDAATNKDCPNGFEISLVHIITKYDGIPPNGDELAQIAPPDDIHQQANGCPPAAFFVVKRTSLQSCSTQYCWEPSSGYGFYAHSRPLVPNPKVPSYADFLLVHEATGWNSAGPIEVDPKTPEALNLNRSPYKRQVSPALPDGTCVAQ